MPPRFKPAVAWSISSAQKAREIARELAIPMQLRARVTGHTTDMMRSIGGSSVRIEFLDAPLQPGGWLVGVQAPGARDGAFLPAIGGAPGDHRHGLLDAMIMAQPAADDEVTYLPDAALARWLPLGAAVTVAPIWQCTDFFDLRRQFDAVDVDGSGEIDDAELRELLSRVVTGGAGASGTEERALCAATRAGGVIDFKTFCASGFQETRLLARLHELSTRAAERAASFHAGPPWHGELETKEGSFAALVEGTGLGSGHCGASGCSSFEKQAA